MSINDKNKDVYNKKDRYHEIIEISTQIYKELLELENQKNQVQSSTIKELLTKNYNIGAKTFIQFQEVVELFKAYLKKTLEYSQKFDENSINFANQILENITEHSKLIGEIKSDSIRLFTKNLIEIQRQMGIRVVQSADNMSKINEFMEFVALEMVYLSFYNCYLPYTINDYDRNKIIKDSTKSILKSLLGLGPIISLIITGHNVINDLKLILNALDAQNLKKDFFSSLDYNITKLETQTKMLMFSYSNQEKIIDYLKTMIKTIEEDIQRINDPIDEN